MPFFKSDTGVRGIFGDAAFNKLVKLLTNCCNDVITLPVQENYFFKSTGSTTNYNFSGVFDTDITIETDVSNAKIGDIMNIIFVAGSSPVVVNLKHNIYVTGCNSRRTSITISPNERIVLHLFFDGKYFTNTLDNC